MSDETSDDPAILFIRKTAAAEQWGTAGGIRKLPYSLYRAVAAMMEAYRNEPLAAVEPPPKCPVCCLALYGDAAQAGYCTHHEPKGV